MLCQSEVVKSYAIVEVTVLTDLLRMRSCYQHNCRLISSKAKFQLQIRPSRLEAICQDWD